MVESTVHVRSMVESTVQSIGLGLWLSLQFSL